MTRNLCLIAFLIISNSAWAENVQSGGATHNRAEERACGGDARRWCKEAAGDDFRIASCLQDHKERLSRACRMVLDGHGM